uniref:Tyrosine-protein phosphatase non-receptor type 9 n=1 Tax=Ascaris suum TaxID=6253 RepID=F1KY67_ASCSU
MQNGKQNEMKNYQIRDNRSRRTLREQLSLRRRLKRKPNLPVESASIRMRRRKNKGIVCAVGSKTRNAATAEPRSVKKIPDTGRERVKSLPKEVVNTVNMMNTQRMQDNNEIKLNDAQKQAYVTFLNEIFGLGVNGILQQYNTYLKTYIPPDITHSAFDRNMSKNRYKDVVCIDKTRVVLNSSQDYIHANYVAGPPLLNTFICTQGPMKRTVNEFWEMIVQVNAAFIFMLCNTIEGEKKKCFQYWPSREGSALQFGAIKIENSHVDDAKDPNFITASLSVTKNNEQIKLHHILWKNWPDKGVPKNELAPFRLLKLSRETPKRPTVVHCSAGIGRTGTIVAIEMGLQELLAGHPLDIVHTIQQLRNMRMNSVQTEQQLVYAVKCLISYAWTCGVFYSYPDLIKKSEKFEEEYSKMLKIEEAKKDTKTTPKLETVQDKLETLRRLLEKKSAEAVKMSKKIVEPSRGRDDKGASSSPDAIVEKPMEMVPVRLPNATDISAKKFTSHREVTKSERRRLSTARDVRRQRKAKCQGSTRDVRHAIKSAIAPVQPFPNELEPFSTYN